MIDKALDLLAGCIHEFLKSLPELNIGSEKAVQLTHIVKDDGSLAIPNNTLGLTLINIEEERTVKAQQGVAVDGSGRVAYRNPEIKLNLYILLAANFSDYKTGLEFISAAVRFFQAKNVFTPQDTAAMDPAIIKLIAELHSINFEQQNNLWGALGAKYLPSVIYKIRLLTLQEGRMADEGSVVSDMAIAGRGK